MTLFRTRITIPVLIISLLSFTALSYGQKSKDKEEYDNRIEKMNEKGEKDHPIANEELAEWCKYRKGFEKKYIKHHLIYLEGEAKKTRKENPDTYCRKCDGQEETICKSCDSKRRIDIECPECSGERTRTCPKCEGIGKVTCKKCSGRGSYVKRIRIVGKRGRDESITVQCKKLMKCGRCSGRKALKCRKCRGKGILKKKGICDKCDRFRFVRCIECVGGIVKNPDARKQSPDLDKGSPSPKLSIPIEELLDKVLGTAGGDETKLQRQMRELQLREIWKPHIGHWTIFSARILEVSRTENMKAKIKVYFQSENSKRFTETGYFLITEDIKWAGTLKLAQFLRTWVQLGPKAGELKYGTAILVTGASYEGPQEACGREK